MKFALPILIAAAVILIFPYIKFLFKRISMPYRVKKACRANGYTFKAAHPFWIFALNNSGHADFYCESNFDNRVYSVKLFGVLHRMTTFYFIDGDRYQWKRQIPLAGKGVPVGNFNALGGIIHTMESKIKEWNKVDYYHNREEDWSKRIIPVLLGNPVPMEVKRAREVHKENLYFERPDMFAKEKKTELKCEDVYDSDYLWDAYLFSARGFIRELEVSMLK